MKKTIQVPVDEIRVALRNGVPDEELMRKYGLSETELKGVFDRILKAVSNGLRHIQVEREE